MLLLSAFLTISLTEVKIVKNSLIANSIFYSNNIIYAIVKSTKFTLVLSLVISFLASVLVLVQILYLDYWLLGILGLDAVVIWILNVSIKKRLKSRVKEMFLDVISRRWAIWLNTLLLMITFVAYQFFVTPSLEVASANCEILEFVSSAMHQEELLEWKATTLLLNNFDTSTTFVGWLVYLVFSQGFFAWAYSRLLLSAGVATKNRNYFFMGFVGAIVMLLLSSVAVEQLYEKHKLEKHKLEKHKLEKARAFIDKAYIEIDNRIDSELTSGEQRILKDVDKIIDDEVDVAFESAYRGIPALSAYYYSIKGEYTRLALKGHDLYCGYKNNTMVPFYNKLLPKSFKIEKCDEHKLDNEIEQRVKRYLFVESNLTVKIDKASTNVNIAIQRVMGKFRDRLNTSISSLDSVEKHNYKEIDDRLDTLNYKFDEVFKASMRDVAKKGFSGVGAVLLTSSISKTIISKMLLKLGAKSAGKAATFAASTTTGLTICAPTGPWALLCGVVTGTASWIGVDAAMTKIDQAYNEESFQLSTRKMMDAEKYTLKALIKDSYHIWIVDIFKQLRQSSDSLKSPYKQIIN